LGLVITVFLVKKLNIAASSPEWLKLESKVDTKLGYTSSL